MYKTNCTIWAGRYVMANQLSQREVIKEITLKKIFRDVIDLLVRAHLEPMENCVFVCTLLTFSVIVSLTENYNLDHTASSLVSQ